MCVEEKEEEAEEEEDWEPPAHTNLPLKLFNYLPAASSHVPSLVILSSSAFRCVRILHLWSHTVTFLLFPFSSSSPTQPLHPERLALARQASVSAETSSLVVIFEAIDCLFLGGEERRDLPPLLLPLHFAGAGSEMLDTCV